MSHIPASAMPHAHASDDTVDDQPPQPEQRQPEPDPTARTPERVASETATGMSSRTEPESTARTSGADQDRAGDQRREEPAFLSSPVGIATVVAGTALALGGAVLAAMPLLRDDKPKAKKRKRRKND